MKNLRFILSKPVDIAFLIYFRIAFGIFVIIELINQMVMGDILNYIDPEFNFTFQFFPWVRTLPEMGMYVLFGIIIGSALCVTLGFKYRIATVVLFISNTWYFLMEKTEYVNHAYLYCIICFFLIFLPAHTSFSLDNNRKKYNWTQVPGWMFYLLIFQMSIVYFYAGIAKIHGDWLEARAMTLWMASKSDISIVGDIIAHPNTAWILSYGGMIFDLLVAPGLLWRRTRLVSFIIACMFHLTNVVVFGLATFPWFSIMMTTLYFGPSWSRKIPILGERFAKQPEFKEEHAPMKSFGYGLLLTYAIVQLLLPFRHFIYQGSPNWTEEGHRFSWHMMLRTKSTQLVFKIKADGEGITDDGRDFITYHQYKKMSGDPDMILEFAHFLGEQYKKKGYDDVKVFVEALVSLNGRPYQAIIDRNTDLMKLERSLCHYDWIVPLKD